MLNNSTVCIFLAAFTEYPPEPPGIPPVLTQEIFIIREKISKVTKAHQIIPVYSTKPNTFLYTLFSCKDTNCSSSSCLPKLSGSWQCRKCPEKLRSVSPALEQRLQLCCALRQLTLHTPALPTQPKHPHPTPSRGNGHHWGHWGNIRDWDQLLGTCSTKLTGNSSGGLSLF